MIKPHLSVSQLNMLARCPQQYERRYVMGEKKPPGVSLIIGKGVHVAVEKDLEKKMETGGELLPDEAIADYAADATRRFWQDTPPVMQDKDPDEGEAADEAIVLAQLHHAKVAPTVTPVALERPFVLELPDFPFDVHGVVDVEEPGIIRDTKTKGKKPNGDPARESLQGELYTLEAKTRGEDKSFVLDFLIRPNTKEGARYFPYPASFGESDHNSFLRRIEVFAKMVQSGIFPPTDPGNWQCSQKWCGWWDSCPWGAKQRVSVGLIDPSKLTSRLGERRP